MKKQTHHKLRKIGVASCIYCLLWGFFWCFLLVYTRSYNRLSHEPIQMVQLSFTENFAVLSLAETDTLWTFPDLSDDFCFWMGTLPNSATDFAICTWQFLWTWWQ